VHPGPKLELRGPPDWRGLETVLRVQRHAIEPGERVLVVDDWAETGSKATTTRRLVEECGGRYVGLSLLVDQLTDELRDRLSPVTTVARADELLRLGRADEPLELVREPLDVGPLVVRGDRNAHEACTAPIQHGRVDPPLPERRPQRVRITGRQLRRPHLGRRDAGDGSE
jgi:hypothetical protein